MEEETRYQPVEPTTPVPYSYGSIPIAPPPPPESFPQKKRRITWRHVLVLYTIIALIVIGEGMYVLPTLRGKQYTSIPTTQSAKQPYDAKSIIQDFQAHGLPLDQLQYGMTINQFVGSDYTTVITTQSSTEFIDPSFCNGPCDVGSVWLGVYNSPIDAQSEYNGLISYRTSLEQNGPGLGALASMIQAGRCLLIGEPATSEYAALLRSDCT